MRDPNCVYAYWELSAELKTAVYGRFGSDRDRNPFILRVYDLTGLNFSTFGYHSYFEVVLHPFADHYFINKIDSNRSYYVELGCYEPGGDFAGIIRSNIVHTPKNSVFNGSGILSTELAGDKNAKKSVLIGTFASLGIYGDSGYKSE